MAITDFFKEINQNFKTLQESIQTLTDGYKKTTDFFTTLFNWVPPEVILIFLLSILLLILINNLSPSTPRANLTVSVFLLCIGWLYLNRLFTNEFKFFYVLKISLYILLPIYSLTIISFGVSKLIVIYRKKRMVSTSSLEGSMENVQKIYHECMAEAHSILSGGKTDDSLLREKARLLNDVTGSLVAILEKRTPK